MLTNPNPYGNVSCYNTGKEDIPPYAIMVLSEILRPRNTGWINLMPNETSAIWRVKKTDQIAEDRQDPAILVVNGHYTLRANSYGMGFTGDRVQVLHDGRHDAIAPGQICGPRADDWFAWSSGSAFTCLTHDILQVQNLNNNRVHTIWVSPNNKQSNSARGIGSGHGAVDPNQIIPAGGSISPNTGIAPSIESYGFEYVNGQYKALVDGRYILGFGATITPADWNIPIGTALKLTLFANGQPTGLTKHGIFHKHTDPISNVVTDVVPVPLERTGYIALKKEDLVCIKNTSTVRVLVSDFHLWLYHVGNYQEHHGREE